MSDRGKRREMADYPDLAYIVKQGDKPLTLTTEAPRLSFLERIQTYQSPSLRNNIRIDPDADFEGVYVKGYYQEVWVKTGAAANAYTYEVLSECPDCGGKVGIKWVTTRHTDLNKDSIVECQACGVTVSCP
jgi:DNA-directed RNA polymerase subunit RPC12/RpoP